MRRWGRRDKHNAVTDQQRAGLHAQLDQVAANCDTQRADIASREARLSGAQDAFMQAELDFNVSLDEIAARIDAPAEIEQLRINYTRTRGAAALVGEAEVHLRLLRVDLAATESRLMVLREAVERLPSA